MSTVGVKGLHTMAQPGHQFALTAKLFLNSHLIRTTAETDYHLVAGV